VSSSCHGRPARPRNRTQKRVSLALNINAFTTKDTKDTTHKRPWCPWCPLWWPRSDQLTRPMMQKITAAALTLASLGLTGSVLSSAPTAASLPSWNTKAAAAALDERQTWWASWPSAQRDHGTFCVSCHTALPYALARPGLRSSLGESQASAAETALVENVLKRVRQWNEVAPFYNDQKNGLPKTSESRGTESVLNVAVLVAHDAAKSTLSADTRTALTNMWALQMKTGDLSGAWAWLNFKYEPWESEQAPYFGASIAAIAV